ncbi:hypothetical protein GCM10009809_27130 [Isoptericola hypogeus]|uniref:Phosphoenolpyruvate guanylyltransferase n=1 Tax=Isoptericola hypogeus TaxID=300179 RepID=A0ABP4VKM0_9MICO
MAVVPLRDGVSGKSRLATALDPRARRRLVATLARHVVGVLAAAPLVDAVVVVTADVPFTRETLAGLTPSGQGGIAPVTVVEQPADRPGLNAAVDVGRESAVALGAGRLLVAHADLPLLTTEDVAAVLAAGGLGRDAVVVATDRHDGGTNLLLLPLDAGVGFGFRFGTGSRAAHVAEAERAGLRAAVLHRPGTAADLDTLDDWAQLPAGVRERLHDGVGLPLT